MCTKMHITHALITRFLCTVVIVSCLCVLYLKMTCAVQQDNGSGVQQDSGSGVSIHSSQSAPETQKVPFTAAVLV